jgi:hypothetical protein
MDYNLHLLSGMFRIQSSTRPSNVHIYMYICTPGVGLHIPTARNYINIWLRIGIHNFVS